MSKYLNHVYTAEVLLFFAIISGLLPREFAFVLAGILITYTLFSTLDDALVLFALSIPLFIALPITANFDSLNTWRIIAVLIFIRWLWIARPMAWIASWRHSRYFWALGLILVCALLSVLVASDMSVSLNRLIYFANLSMVGIVIAHRVSLLPAFAMRIAKNLVFPVMIVMLVGYLQLALTYFIDIYQFIYFWGEGIQCRQFGNEWCYIATHVGNTWFAYFGDQRSLRVFSLFTDSHTFPIYLLLGLPSVFLVKSDSSRRWMWWIAIAAILLMVILSGTRGIWAAGVGIAFWIILLRLWFRKKNPATMAIPIFFLLFLVAWPIFTSPQFLLAHGGLFRHRVKSIFDFSETSNKDRIAIWKASLVSIQYHPALGVGIGNFPQALNERLELSKAGSSAHNLYLHIAVEMGLASLIALIWFLWQVLKKLFSGTGVYEESMLVFFPWVFLYVMTDVALFDERAFLMLSTILALIIASRTIALPSHG